VNSADEIIDAVGDYGFRLGTVASSLVIDDSATCELAAHLLAEGVGSLAAPAFGELPGSELLLEAYFEAGLEDDEDAATAFCVAYVSGYAVGLEDGVTHAAQSILYGD
jgi:hypothetical protein